MKRIKTTALGMDRCFVQVQALQRIIASISSGSDLPSIIASVAEELEVVFEADRVAVFLGDNDSGRMTLAGASGFGTVPTGPVKADARAPFVRGFDLRAPVFVRNVKDAGHTDLLPDEIGLNGAHGMLVLPVAFAGEVVGVVALVHDEPRAYDEDEIALASSFANQLGIAVRSGDSCKKEKEQEQALSRKNRQLAALLRTSNVLVEGNDARELLKLIASTIRQVLGYRSVKAYMANEENDLLELVAWEGVPPDDRAWRAQRVPSVHEVLSRLIRTESRISNSYLVSHYRENADNDRHFPMEDQIPLEDDQLWDGKDILVVPLCLKDKRLVGILCVGAPVDGKLPDLEAIQLLELFAGQAAVAIRNARLYARLRSALKAKDEFLAVVSHELRTPLTSIMAYTQHLLQKLPESEDIRGPRSHLEVINAQSRRMASLVQEVLDVSALEKGTLKINKAKIDLGELVRKSVASARATAARHQFVVQLPSEPVAISADENRIQQVVGNLLANAVKYSPDGGDIRLLLSVESNNATVSISDSGVGIAPEHIPHIFERFYQADQNPRTRRFGGMGLGLFVSKEIIEAHDGRIWAESSRGNGSRFHFIIPLARG